MLEQGPLPTLLALTFPALAGLFILCIGAYEDPGGILVVTFLFRPPLFIITSVSIVRRALSTGSLPAHHFEKTGLSLRLARPDLGLSRDALSEPAYVVRVKGDIEGIVICFFSFEDNEPDPAASVPSKSALLLTLFSSS